MPGPASGGQVHGGGGQEGEGLTTRDWPDRFVPTLDVDIYQEETVLRDSWPTRAATWREPRQLCESDQEVFHNGAEPSEVGRWL